MATLVSICLWLAPSPALAQNANLVAEFNGTNGSTPVSGLIQLPNGNFLGVTLPTQVYPKAAGTIYELTSAGVIQPVYRLAADGSQGTNLGFQSGVTQASDGKIYGVMNSTSAGPGMVYRFTLPAGPFEVLHTFSARDSENGLEPTGSLVQALDGNLYGVCTGGGNSDGIGDTFGTIFRIGLDGTFATTYKFSNSGTVGYQPLIGLVLNSNGLLYGTTFQAPASLYSYDPLSATAQSVVEQVNPSSTQIAVGMGGGLYLASSDCSGNGCSGQIVRYGQDGSGPVVEFTFPETPGAGPSGSLVALSDGTFVGGTFYVGTSDQQVFHANPTTQTFTSYSVPKTGDTSGFLGNLIQGSSGGVLGALPRIDEKPTLGAVAGLFASLPKPVPAVFGFYPSTVASGTTFSILGNYFVGAKSVTMNGQSLSFTVKASGAISVVAPSAPTTGPVVVSTPGGITTSASVLTVQ